MPTFIDDYNRRFGKLARDRHVAHRAVRKDEDLDAIFAWREYRKVTDSLTLRYERKMYLIEDTPSNRRYIGKYIEVFLFPGGCIEIRVAGVSLPYSTYNKIGIIDHGAIVDNKRLSQVLRAAQVVQAQRDNRVMSLLKLDNGNPGSSDRYNRCAPSQIMHKVGLACLIGDR